MVLIEIPLIVESTSSSENHYELMALAEIQQAQLETAQAANAILADIRTDVHAIRILMEQTFAISEMMRQQAQQVLDAHAQSAQEYLRQIDEPVPVDYHPFVSMPTGTTVRDLPDGGRLFGFTDGAFVRVFPDGQMSVIDRAGSPTSVAPASGGKVTLPGGLELSMVPDAITVTHEAAGIEGLPQSVDPVLASERRYTVELPDGVRLDVSHADRTATVINPSGTAVVLGISRIEGIGEEVQVRTISGGAKSFRSLGSGHAGMIETDGTIHLTLATGRDLVIHFPDQPGGGTDGDDAPICFDCEAPD